MRYTHIRKKMLRGTVTAEYLLLTVWIESELTFRFPAVCRRRQVDSGQYQQNEADERHCQALSY